LQNYSAAGGPYVSLETFDQYGKKYGRVAIGLQHPEKKAAAKKRKEAKLKPDVSVEAAPAEEIPEDVPNIFNNDDECVAGDEATNANDCRCSDCEMAVRNCGCSSCRERYARLWPDNTLPPAWLDSEQVVIPDGTAAAPAEYTVDVATSDED
jgi:hypothetical protein